MAEIVFFELKEEVRRMIKDFQLPFFHAWVWKRLFAGAFAIGFAFGVWVWLYTLSLRGLF